MSNAQTSTRLLIVILLTGASTAVAGGTPLSLRDCLRLALAHHPDVAMAQTDINGAKAALMGARATYFPTIKIEAHSAYQREEATVNQGAASPMPGTGGGEFHSFGLVLQQPLFSGPQGWAGIKRARSAVKRARLSQAAVRADVALNVINAFFLLLMQLEQLDVLEQSMQLSQGQLRLAQERFEIGTGSRVDVTRAMVSAGEDRIRVEEQRKLIRTLQVQLNATMGMSPTSPIAIHADNPDTIALPGQQQNIASYAHPRVALAEIDAETARQEVKLASGEFWPIMVASAQHQRQGQALADVYAGWDRRHGFGASLMLAIPVFEGLSTLSKVREAKAREARAKVAVLAQQQAVATELAQAMSEVRGLQIIETIEAGNIASAEASLVMARERYALGMGTALELRDAQLAATRARLALVKTRFDLQLAVAAYHHARGDIVKTYLSSPSGNSVNAVDGTAQ
ncbi:MAG: TolC family protein [Myxococcota bacterium]|nr:TolC family protein [Myxococcota bacterium]